MFFLDPAFFFVPLSANQFRSTRHLFPLKNHTAANIRHKITHHSKPNTHSTLDKVPGQATSPLACDDAVVVEVLDHPRRCRAVARASATAASGLATPSNREGGPPATVSASSLNWRRVMREFFAFDETVANKKKEKRCERTKERARAKKRTNEK